MSKNLKKQAVESAIYACVQVYTVGFYDTESEGKSVQRKYNIRLTSKDSARYDRLIKILSLYRLSLGHAGQDELIEHLFERICGD
jgi:hypothetical protein